MIRPVCIWMIVLMTVGPTQAGVTPRPGPGDPRIQSVIYDTEQVVSLKVALGFQLTLEFATDDRIQSVAVGNAALWQATPNKTADRLFIKPMQGAAETNLTVVTDARTYVFDLHPAMASATTPYLVRILPPAPVATMLATDEAQGALYAFRGARSLRPVTASDDGKTTTLVWSEATPLPAVYAIGPDGQERLINGAMREGALMIEGVAQQYVLRRGAQEARLSRRLKKVRRS